MKRNFWFKLEAWKNEKNEKVRKPLLVIGARQTGKTYIIEKFCNEKYKKFVKINLFEDKRLIDIYNEISEFDKRVEFINKTYNIDFNDKESVLFVDEVQESEEFIESLKLFCESGYTNIICAGSLLGVKVKRFSKSFPVGKIHQEILYPMNFEEFLIATNNEKYIDSIKDSFVNNKECIFHKDLIDLLHRYLYLGGMPELVQNYIDNNQDLSKVDENILKDIASSYIKDMTKYTKEPIETIRIQNIYKNIAPQLLKENPKFMYAKFDKKNRKSDYITALDWLVSSRLILSCNLIKNPEYPIKLYEDNQNYKLFLSDVGLLRNMMGINVFDIFFQNDYKYKGILAENYVAIEFANCFEDIYYWSKRGNENNNQAEVDFVIQIGTDIIPVEVKAGDNIKSKSLDVYNQEYNPKIRIRISSKNFGREGNLISIPLYATFLVKDIIGNILKQK